MDFDSFPRRYAENIRSETKRKISEYNPVSKPNGYYLEHIGYLAAGPFFGGLIGVIIWIFFGGFLEPLFTTLEPLFTTYDSMLSTIVISIVIGTIIGLAIYIYPKITDPDKDKYISRKTIKKASKKERYLQSECKRLIFVYESQFEAEAKKLSANFVGSILTNKVADWITFRFVDLINSANRNSHIEIISIPIKFMVYKTQIICEDGTFSFLLQRCKNLESALEQKALAYAIASTIHLNIKKRYPKDISGTDVAVHINYTNDVNHVTVTMTYTAENGNYQPPNEWTN